MLFFSTRTFCSRVESCEKGNIFTNVFKATGPMPYVRWTSCSPDAVGPRVVLWLSKQPLIGERLPTPASKLKILKPHTTSFGRIIVPLTMVGSGFFGRLYRYTAETTKPVPMMKSTPKCLLNR